MFGHQVFSEAAMMIYNFLLDNLQESAANLKNIYSKSLFKRKI